MDTTELTETPHEESLPGLKLNDEAKYFLHKAGQWARFLGIMGFIGTGIVLLCALFIGSIFSIMAKLQPTMLPIAGLGGLFTFIYVLIAVFYFFFSLYLYQFGNNAKAGVTFSNEMQVTVALGKLKSFFKLWGITTIVIISIYILMIIGFIIAIPMMPHGVTGGNTITSLR